MNNATLNNATLNDATLNDATLNDGGEANHPNGASRTLYRHPTQRVLAGVCGGVADWLGWDPVVVRLLWLVLALATSGAGLVVYLLLTLLLPVGMQPSATHPGGAVKRAPVDTRLHSGKPLASLLIGLGALWLLSNLGLLHGVTQVTLGALRLFFWPALLIVIGWRILRALDVRLSDGAAARAQVHAWGAKAAAWSDSLRSGAADGAPPVAAAADGLRRSRTDRLLLGVCGGIAQRYHIDPALVRLLWVLVTLGTLGFGLVAYLLAALLLPQAEAMLPATAPAPATAPVPATAQAHQPVDPSAEQEIPIAGAGPVDF